MVHKKNPVEKESIERTLPVVHSFLWLVYACYFRFARDQLRVYYFVALLGAFWYGQHSLISFCLIKFIYNYIKKHIRSIGYRVQSFFAAIVAVVRKWTP